MAKPTFRELIPEGLKSIKFGPGVVGRSGTAVIFAVLSLAVIAWRAQTDDTVLIIAYMVCAIFVLWLLLAFGFAFKNPNHAVMEGSVLSALLKAQMAEQGKERVSGGNIYSTEVIEVPSEQTSLPTTPSEEGHRGR